MGVVAGHSKHSGAKLYQNGSAELTFFYLQFYVAVIMVRGSIHEGGEFRRHRCDDLWTPKEQYPRNSQVPVLHHVSTLESGTAVSTDGENRRPRFSNTMAKANFG